MLTDLSERSGARQKGVCSLMGGAGSTQGRITKGGDKVALICFFCESKLLSFPQGENYICNVI